MERYITGTGQRLLVHPLEDCRGKNCVIHSPSVHCMSDFPTNWRSDRQLMERICPHGIGHPDPDDLAFKRDFVFSKYPSGRANLESEMIHDCDGCCKGVTHA